jgi:AAA family ATP:ADP antiporter
MFVYPIAIRFGGWLWAALLTPLCFAITGLAFYGTQYAELMAIGGASLFAQFSPVIVGAMHLSLIRGARYSVYDATKESAYVGLPLSDQIQGKAAIDSVTSRLGKSMGSMIFFGLFAFVGNSITDTVPYVIALSMFLSIYWIKSIFTLNNIRNADLKVADASNKDYGSAVLA